MNVNQNYKALASEQMRLEMYRQRKTDANLAEMLNVSVSTANRKKLGMTILDIDELEKISEWLKIDFISLFESKEKEAA